MNSFTLFTLFTMTTRTSKYDDVSLAKKANSISVQPKPTIKGGDSLMERIFSIKKMIELHLGKYRDDYIVINTEQALSDYISACIENGIVAIDTETTGLDPILDSIVGVSLYTPGQKPAYIPINHVNYITLEHVENQLPPELVKEQLQRLIDAHITIIMFNASFDIRVLRNQLKLEDIYCDFDCYLAARLLNENEDVYALKKLHQKYILDDKEDAFKFDEYFKGIPFSYIPIDFGYLYAAHDAIITFELYEFQKQFIDLNSEREDMRKIAWVFYNIEMPCVSVVADMEDAGVLFDFDYNMSLKDKYHKLLDDRETAFHNACEKYSEQIAYYRKKMGSSCKLENPINIKSSDQLAILLYDIMGCELFKDKVKKKKTRTTSEAHLKHLNNDITKAVLDYREFSTIVDTFIDKLPNCVNPNDGRIHCSFNQYGAKTGRMSSSNPNLQNIPSHNKDIRRMFKASEGYVLMSSDFSQQEPKCLAAMCKQAGDPQMYNSFIAGKDLYSEIASKSFNKPYEECLEHFPKGSFIKKVGDKWVYGTEEDHDKIADGENDVYADGKARRSQAKSVLLGVLYGRGEASIGEQLNVSTEKAKEIKSSVFKGFPAIREFEQNSLNMAYDLGYVTTVCGRKRRLPDLQLPEFEFKWINGSPYDIDPLDFEGETDYSVPYELKMEYMTLLQKARYNQKQDIIKRAESEGIQIVDNGGKIAEATRQCVNARIQGSAADLTKLAMIELNKNPRLKELGFKLLIPVHDEVIAECPEENVKECSKLLADTMSQAAERILQMPIKCDVEITRAWYGEALVID